jgi:hypothetical protein
MHETYNAEAKRVVSVTNTTIIQAKKIFDKNSLE